MQQQHIHSHLDARTQEEIKAKRQTILRIKANHAEKVNEANQQPSDDAPQYDRRHSSTSTVFDPASIAPRFEKKQVEEVNKNPGVSDTDRMVFDKKFKNYLNHRLEYLQKARRGRSVSKNKGKGEKRCPLDLGQAEYFNEQEVLSNTGSEYQYQNASDMKAAYEEMTTGKKRKGGKGELYPPQLYQNQMRRFEFQALLAEGEQEQQVHHSISKDRILNYLFDEPIIMMLYSINPYNLGDELAQFETKRIDILNYQEFSNFLLVDREPTYFEYTEENMLEARKLGRGIKCAPIIAKWIDQSGIFEFLVETYKSIDIRGDSQVDRSFLARKLRKQAAVKRITEVEVIQIVNINKNMPLNRLIYQIQFEDAREDEAWSEQEFLDFLTNYKRKITPQKDKLITKLIMTGKYDSSYIYVVSQEAIQFIKDVFSQTPKFAEYFVLKQKFLQNLCKDPRYKKIQSMLVRSESNRYVKKQTVQQTLVRMYSEGEEYLDIEEILDFMTNRGRPKVVEYRVYIQNLQRQLAIIEDEDRIKKERYGDNYDTASSDEEFNDIIRKKQIQRKKDKLKAIRSGNNFDTSKKFNVTIPMPFGFEKRDNKQKKESIRQRKVRLMLEEKDRALKEEMKPMPVREVPEYVKQNLYERMLKEQQRQRKERLEKFRLEIMSMVNVSDRLMRPKSNEPHCDFGLEQYKFTARPMPWYCEVNLIDRINKKKQERKERILEEIINKHSDYDLPEGVQKMIQRQDERQERKAAKARTASTGSVGECTFIPRITQGIPDFKMIHEHLHFDLENAKNVKQPLKMIPFSFENRPEKSRTTYDKPKPKAANIRHSKYEKVDNQEEFQNIPKTEKFEALVQLRRRQLEQKQKEKEKEQRNDAVRKLRESKFAPVVWRALKNNSGIDPAKSRALIAGRIKEFKREEVRRKEQYEDQMIRILTKVYERPLLLESGAGQRAPGDSYMSRPEGQYEGEEDYLGAGYEPRKDMKLMLDKQRKGEPHPHMDDDHRRAIVENHHLGQYPPEGYDDEEYDEQDEGMYQQEMYGQQFQQGNLHTS